MAEVIYLAPERLQKFATATLRAVEVPADDAAWIAEALVQANLWGVDTHGIVRLPGYVDRFRRGAINPTPTIHPLRQLPALVLLDGDNGSGYVVGRAAMSQAISLAEAAGVGMVAAIHSNHFGAAGHYAMLAAARNMVGVVMSNVTPLMAVPGGGTPVVGNNPIAVAVPRGDGFPFLLDTSLSVVANGNLIVARLLDQQIPLDWAVDQDGRPTGDPHQATAIMPIAGHKGIGLAYAVEMLTGVIAGGSFLSQIAQHASGRTGGVAQTMWAIDAAALLGSEHLADRLDAFETLLSASAGPGPAMHIPGQNKDLHQRRRRQQGIPLPPRVAAELAALGTSLQVPWPPPVGD